MLQSMKSITKHTLVLCLTLYNNVKENDNFIDPYYTLYTTQSINMPRKVGQVT